MLRGITSFTVFIAILATLLGVVAARSEIFNPLSAQAQAYRLNVETRAIADKNDYQRESYQIELDKQRALAQRELEWYDRKMALTEDVVTLLTLGVVVGIIGLGFGGGIYLASLGFDALQRRRLLPQAIESGEAKILPFPPDPIQRSRRQPQPLPESAA